MKQDIESDFWKEIFRHLQHRNMSRIGAERLTVCDALKEIEEFKVKHPKILFSTENSGSYVTFETEIAENIKLRLFIQSQIKASLLQNNGTEWIKIADAKFPNNPFPEVELLLENRKKYESELKKQKHENFANDVKTKISVELIKAMLMKKYSSAYEDVSVVLTEKSFDVKICKKDEKLEFSLSKENFTDEILKSVERKI